MSNVNKDKVREALRFLENITGGKSCDEIHARDLLREALAPDIPEWQPTKGELGLFSSDKKGWAVRVFSHMERDKYLVYCDGRSTGDTYPHKYCKPHPTHLHKQPYTGVAPDCKLIWLELESGYTWSGSYDSVTWSGRIYRENPIKQFAIIE